jgi:hypothetical protein
LLLERRGSDVNESGKPSTLFNHGRFLENRIAPILEDFMSNAVKKLWEANCRKAIKRSIIAWNKYRAGKDPDELTTALDAVVVAHLAAKLEWGRRPMKQWGAAEDRAMERLVAAWEKLDGEENPEVEKELNMALDALAVIHSALTFDSTDLLNGNMRLSSFAQAHALREAVREIANQERRTLSAQIYHFVATHRYDRHLAMAVQIKCCADSERARQWAAVPIRHGERLMPPWRCGRRRGVGAPLEPQAIDIGIRKNHRMNIARPPL